MGTDEKGKEPTPLDYFRPNLKGARMPKDAEFLRWQALRTLYWIGLFAVIAPIAIPVFSNEMMFGKMTRLTPADFVPDIQTKCVPVVRAIKRYEQDTGHPPEYMANLVPKYLDARSINGNLDVQSNQFTEWVSSHGPSHCVTYDFNPATEGWTVTGEFVNGPILLPKVTLAPPANDAPSQP